MPGVNSWYRTDLSFTLNCPTVKVNSVCPGNFYEGPLERSENGLFVQHLKAGKVPVPKPWTIRRHYLSQTPIQRLYRARCGAGVLYFTEQSHETGAGGPAGNRWTDYVELKENED